MIDREDRVYNLAPESNSTTGGFDDSDSESSSTTGGFEEESTSHTSGEE